MQIKDELTVAGKLLRSSESLYLEIILGQVGGGGHRFGPWRGVTRKVSADTCASRERPAIARSPQRIRNPPGRVPGVLGDTRPQVTDSAQLRS